MPYLSSFFGIIIRMNYEDHNPPHFHAYYQGYVATFDFNGNILKGKFPHKEERIVEAWSILHVKDLEANWYLVRNGEEPFKIDPIR